MNARRATAAPLAAFVLHSHDWSESSRIVELFTREQGRAVVAAKGAKRPYSQLRPVLLPFQRLQVVLGRIAAGDEASEVQTLRSAEWAGGVPTLRGEALFSGFYLNELLLKLLARHDPHPALFDAYAAALPELASADDNHSQAVLRAFELTLLREIGLLPELNVATLTLDAVEPSGRYALRPEAGVVASAAEEALLSGDQLVGLQAALQHGSLAALHAACARCLAPLRSQLRALLHYHLGTPQLRTRQVMLDVQRLVDSARPARR
jgi:DNA repair protein RecO (recombination protein O)